MVHADGSRRYNRTTGRHITAGRARTPSGMPVPATGQQLTMAEQQLYLVFGGRVKDPRASEFVDLSALDIRGIFPAYEEAFEVWRGASQQSVDDAFIKYLIVRLR